MTPHYADELVTLYLGDCVEVMAELPAESVDAIVTDPPYGLEFMGKEWDALNGAGFHTPKDEGRTFTNASGHMYDNLNSLPRFGKGASMQSWHEAWAREALRVAKPGAHLLAFGGTRTVHRLAAAIEDAGWEIRDMLIWGYSSGFPKSLNVSGRLAEAVPEDARCACEPRSTRTALGSQDGYRPERGSGDGQPLPAGDGDLEPAPSPADAPGHIRGDQLWDDLGLALARSLAPATIGRPASEGSPLLASPLLAGSPASDSEASGTASSTSGASQPGSRRKASRTRHTPGSDAASSDPAWSPPRGDTFPYSKCTTCGGWQTADGYGSALKPAFEPIVLARKPLSGTLAQTVTAHGTGALNIDATRIPAEPYAYPSGPKGNVDPTSILLGRREEPVDSHPAGRWPANLILTDPIFDGGVAGVVGGGETASGSRNGDYAGSGAWTGPYGPVSGTLEGDSGTYSRFFLVPKSSRSDREPLVRGEGTTELHLNGAFAVICAKCNRQKVNVPGAACQCAEPEWVRRSQKPRINLHPTVKSLDLMRHLVRLVTPPGGTVLDCFLGSGTTAIAANAEGFRCIGIEREREYLDIALARLAHQPLGMAL